MSNLRIVRPCITVQVGPVGFQFWPPSVDLRTPILCVSPASPSRVARYIISELVGSIASSPQPISARGSVLVLQVVPPSSLRHNPPAGAPPKMVLPEPKRMKFTRPAPPPPVGWVNGPSAVQLADCC